MSFVAKLQHAREVLEQQGRLSVRALGRELALAGDELDEVIEELVEVQGVAVREGNVLDHRHGACRAAREGNGTVKDLPEVIGEVRRYLEQNGRVSLRMLRRQFDLDEESLEELIEELVDIQRVAVREDNALAWSGNATPKRATRTSTCTTAVGPRDDAHRPVLRPRAHQRRAAHAPRPRRHS